MTQIRIFTDIHGWMTSASRDQLRSILKSTGGMFGEKLAAAALPKIEEELRSRAAASRLMATTRYSPNSLGMHSQPKFYDPY